MRNEQGRFNEAPNYRPITGAFVWLMFVTAIAVLYHDVNADRTPSSAAGGKWDQRRQESNYDERDDELETPQFLITPLPPPADKSKLLDAHDINDGKSANTGGSAAASS
jgi:hypothetical protein